MRITIEIEASKTIIETMQRSGFTVASDGAGMQIKVPHAPNITNRKTRIVFNEIVEPIKQLTEELS